MQLEVEGSGFLYRQVRNMVWNMPLSLDFSFVFDPYSGFPSAANGAF